MSVWFLLLLISTASGDLSAVKEFREGAENTYIPFFQSLGLERVRTRTLKIRVFPTLEEFKKFQKENSESTSNLAFYSLFNSEIYTWNDGNADLLLRNISHEATHHYVREFIAQEIIPRCLDEGLAEIFEAGQKISHHHSQTVRQAHAKQKLMPFPFFLGMPVKDFVFYQNPEFPKLHISECWAISYFFVYEQGGRWRPILKALLTQSGGQKTPEQIMTGALFGGYTLADLTRDWEKFVAGL